MIGGPPPPVTEGPGGGATPTPSPVQNEKPPEILGHHLPKNPKSTVHPKPQPKSKPPSQTPNPNPKPPPPQTPIQNTNPNPGPALELLGPHNVYRKMHGVQELSWSNEISAIAQRNVDWQDSQGVWGHQAWEAGMVPFSMGIGGENSAAGTDDLTNRWYRSPGHQANMLNPDATHMGCGLSFGNVPQAVCLFAKM